MLLIGNFNTLQIIRITAAGAVLSSEAGNILLPGRLVPKGAEPGETLSVFVYVDSEGRLTATTRKPFAVVGDFALLKVKDNVSVGTFLDWGLEKDLLLPFGEQTDQLRRGQDVLVYVYLHSSERVAASARLDKFLKPADDTLAEGNEVELLVYAFSDLGAKVIINNTFSGLLFRNELYGNPAIGERMRGYVKKIREDGKVDVTLRMGGTREAANDQDVILDALKARNGLLPLSDKSTPEAIAELLRMSKKSFKRGIGGLYKEGLVDITPEGVKLRSPKK
ncbi:CvfB family protein [Pelotalea chapellei]|uniref:GntR family transcriptional regulator n=1 Tax=Pelotalea chapellei TaxID=44671 RepID=A0ABS5U610_9BACT|nr:S1-like domain-containing RNA-binding protein [Pelotalea chapellei]MBT1071091.1 GntR family transcriptional regulator [Pelotalea chapellei]